MDVLSGSAGSGLFRQMGSVLLVFGLLGLTLWKLKRGGTAVAPLWRTRRRPRSLQSVERLVLTPHHALHVVRLNGKEILFATHPHGCDLIEGRSLLGEPQSDVSLSAGARAGA